MKRFLARAWRPVLYVSCLLLFWYVLRISFWRSVLYTIGIDVGIYLWLVIAFSVYAILIHSVKTPIWFQRFYYSAWKEKLRHAPETDPLISLPFKVFVELRLDPIFNENGIHAAEDALHQWLAEHPKRMGKVLQAAMAALDDNRATAKPRSTPETTRLLTEAGLDVTIDAEIRVRAIKARRAQLATEGKSDLETNRIILTEFGTRREPRMPVARP